MSGWYWFLIERAEDYYETPDGTIYAIGYAEGKGRKRKPPHSNEDKLIDTKWFAYVQGFENEWGYVCESELRRTPLVWEIPREAIHYSGRRRE
jgi:hypothetical protein